MNKIIFFLGKGGVGKSTVSALSSICLASKNKKVLLVSLDPAHNQSDIFCVKFGEKPKKISSELYIKEIDEKYWMKKYLKDIESNLSRAYSYQTAFNLINYFSIIKYSPGIEEYSILLAFNKIVAENKKFDYIIFDMPPTALTLKFFNLPSLSILWLNKLLELRKTIISKKEIITSIKFGKKEFQRDKVINQIEKSLEDYNKIHNLFKDTGKTSINIIINPDKLSDSESLRIIEELKKVELKPNTIILNKLCCQEEQHNATKKFKKSRIECLHLADHSLIGEESLKKYIADNEVSFDFFN